MDEIEITEAIADLLSQGLSDEEIAAEITTVGGQLHLRLGYMIGTVDLVGVIRRLMARSLAIIDVYGDGQHLLVVPDTPGLDALIDEWRELDSAYVEGESRCVGISEFLEDCGVTVYTTRSVGL